MAFLFVCGGAAWETLADFPKDPPFGRLWITPRPDPTPGGRGVGGFADAACGERKFFGVSITAGPFSGYRYYQLIDNRSTARPKSRQTPLQNDNEQLTKFWMLFGYMSEEVFFFFLVRLVWFVCGDE